jgi:adenosylmethionine-8-amino-7-oxononanoate aminotransferase
MIQDEVICGFGRLGTWFGAQRFGVQPDLVTFAKGVTSGYLPLGGVIASKKVREPFWAEGAPAFRHGYTYTGHPVACAAAHANLDIIEREGLVDRVRELEPVLAAALEPLRDLPGVATVHHIGLVGSVELTEEVRAARPGIAEEINLAARRHGVITRGLRGVALQLSPPFVTTPDELQAMVDGIAAGIRDVVPAHV